MTSHGGRYPLMLHRVSGKGGREREKITMTPLVTPNQTLILPLFLQNLPHISIYTIPKTSGLSEEHRVGIVSDLS